MTPTFTADPVSALEQLTAYPFMVHALLAGTIVALAAGPVGWLMVLRRETFAGHTLSLMAFPGAACALLLGVPAAIGYLAACTLAGGAIAIGSAGPEGRGGRASALTGTVQAVGLGLGFLFLSLDRGVLGGFENLLFGDFLGISAAQVGELAAVAAGALGILAIGGRRLVFASLDPSAARARGVPVGALGAGFIIVLGLVVAATAQVTGALLVFALLVAPAATAQVLTARVGIGLVLSTVIALLEAWAGLAIAYFGDLPIGLPLTSVALVVYVLARVSRARPRARPKDRELLPRPVGSRADLRTEGG